MLEVLGDDVEIRRQRGELLQQLDLHGNHTDLLAVRRALVTVGEECITDLIELFAGLVELSGRTRWGLRCADNVASRLRTAPRLTMLQWMNVRPAKTHTPARTAT